MRVGVVSRTDTDAVFPVTRRVIELLESQGVEVLVETETAMALEMKNETIDLTDMEATRPSSASTWAGGASSARFSRKR
jgi:NAD kinase